MSLVNKTKNNLGSLSYDHVNNFYIKLKTANMLNSINTNNISVIIKCFTDIVIKKTFKKESCNECIFVANDNNIYFVCNMFIHNDVYLYCIYLKSCHVIFYVEPKLVIHDIHDIIDINNTNNDDTNIFNVEVLFEHDNSIVVINKSIIYKIYLKLLNTMNHVLKYIHENNSSNKNNIVTKALEYIKNKSNNISRDNNKISCNKIYDIIINLIFELLDEYTVFIYPRVTVKSSYETDFTSSFDLFHQKFISGNNKNTNYIIKFNVKYRTTDIIELKIIVKPPYKSLNIIQCHINDINFFELQNIQRYYNDMYNKINVINDYYNKSYDTVRICLGEYLGFDKLIDDNLIHDKISENILLELDNFLRSTRGNFDTFIERKLCPLFLKRVEFKELVQYGINSNIIINSNDKYYKILYTRTKTGNFRKAIYHKENNHLRIYNEIFNKKYTEGSLSLINYCGVFVDNYDINNINNRNDDRDNDSDYSD